MPRSRYGLTDGRYSETQRFSVTLSVPQLILNPNRIKGIRTPAPVQHYDIIVEYIIETRGTASVMEVHNWPASLVSKAHTATCT